jgi:hypothetical protein
MFGAQTLDDAGEPGELAAFAISWFDQKPAIKRISTSAQQNHAGAAEHQFCSQTEIDR